MKSRSLCNTLYLLIICYIYNNKIRYYQKPTKKWLISPSSSQCLRAHGARFKFKKCFRKLF